MSLARAVLLKAMRMTFRACTLGMDSPFLLPAMCKICLRPAPKTRVVHQQQHQRCLHDLCVYSTPSVAQSVEALQNNIS